jgi:polygalacturonase
MLRSDITKIIKREGRIVSRNGSVVSSLALILIMTPAAISAPNGFSYNILEYGAVGDGATINTAAIQAAIDVCHDAGGGTVYLPAGKFLSGTLVLKSNVTLFLDAGAILLGSTQLPDYPAIIPAYRSYTD